MEIRESLIKSYLQDEEVYEVIWHDITVFLRIAIWYLLLLIVVRALWFVLHNSIWDSQILRRSATVVWLWIYLKGTLDLLDSYLDALLITNRWLLLFTWDWLFKQTVTNLQWVSTETIMYEQNSFWDTLFKKWDIRISVEDMKYLFKEVWNPAEKVTQIVSWKEKILWRFHYTENENETESTEKDKYELLVEALWEVVTEYVDKKNWRIQY